MPPKEDSHKWRAAQGGLLLGDGSIWRLRYLIQDYDDYSVCARGEGLAWPGCNWPGLANPAYETDWVGMERTRAEPEAWRIVGQTDGRGEEQGTSVSNIEHIAGDTSDGKDKGPDNGYRENGSK